MWSAIGRTFKEDYTCHECVLTVQALFMAFLCFKIGGFLIERKNEKVKQSARNYNDLRNGKSPCRFCSRRGEVCTEDVRQHLVTGSTGGCDRTGTDYKKEVYSSLFVGILVGGMFYSGFSFEGTITHIFQEGIVGVLSDSYNVGILIFLVILGTMVCLMNKAGGSTAFGEWASSHIKSRVGAQLATIVLGVLIFIDDYFNCLTVGSVMRPVTDAQNVSRAKLAYLIDATAAPVCIIAPISSWAASRYRFCRR